MQRAVATSRNAAKGSAGSAPPQQSAERRGQLRLDCAFLILLTVLSCAFFIFRVGFYADDNIFLEILSGAKDQTFAGLYHAVLVREPSKEFRPFQVVLVVAPYWLLGAHAIVYQLVNAFWCLSAVLLLYAVVLEVTRRRIVAVSVASVYATLPHFSTDHYWYAASEANASVAFYLLSTFAVLRALQAEGRRRVLWLAAALAGIAGSVTSYEVALPFFVVTVALVVIRARELAAAGRQPFFHTARIVLPVYAVALVGAYAWKLTAALRLGDVSSYHVGIEQSVVDRFVYVFSGAVKVNFGTYFVGVPYVLWWILANRFDVIVAAIALVAGGLTFFYLRRVARAEIDLRGRFGWWRVVAAGLLMFVLGYVIFLTNPEGAFSSASIDNRINIAAALGVAIALVGAAGWVSELVGRRYLRDDVTYCALVGVYVALGSFILSTLGGFWATSYQRQQAVLDRIEERLPHPSPGTGIILDGVCPGIGPGVVFGSRGDFTSALKTRFHDFSLRGGLTTVGYEIVIESQALVLRRKGPGTATRYTFSRPLFLYDDRTGALSRLSNAADAKRRLASLHNHCPDGSPRDFRWQLPTRRWLPFAIAEHAGASG